MTLFLLHKVIKLIKKFITRNNLTKFVLIATIMQLVNELHDLY